MKSISHILLTAILLSSSCKTSKIYLTHLEKNGEVILSMERTPCFGACPVFEVTLYSNGLLLYNGKRFTKHTGCGYAKVSKEEIVELTRFILDAGFFNLENKYPVDERGPTDLPGCTIYFKSGRLEKKIDDRGWQTPSNLINIEKRVDSLILAKKLQFCDK